MAILKPERDECIDHYIEGKQRFFNPADLTGTFERDYIHLLHGLIDDILEDMMDP